MFKPLIDEEESCSCVGTQHEVSMIAYMLMDSIIEEEAANKKYMERAEIAGSQGDTETAALFEHLAKDEDQHYHELKDRLVAVKGTR